MTVSTTARNANLQDLVALLQDQDAAKLDVVVPASQMHAENGVIVVAGSEQLITMDGVTAVDGRYNPTKVMDENISAKLGIPRDYLRTMRETRPDLYDANVNGWLHGDLRDNSGNGADPRKFMLRLFRGDEGNLGVGRAMLSDKYKVMDSLDVLLATLQGVKDAGVNINIKSADLTERRMIVRIEAPEVTALAPVLLAGYRSPFTGQMGSDNPIVSAGFRITNSETGGGAFSITPEVTVQVCKNGMVLTKDAMSHVHLGRKMDAGVVRWADDTQQANIDLVSKMTRDAVTTFISPDYLTAAVAQLEERAEEAVDTVDAVKDITKRLAFTEEHTEGILGYFIKGGQTNRAGVVNAITAYSQTVEDGDVAHQLDSKAVEVLLSR